MASVNYTDTWNDSIALCIGGHVVSFHVIVVFAWPFRHLWSSGYDVSLTR